VEVWNDPNAALPDTLTVVWERGGAVVADRTMLVEAPPADAPGGPLASVAVEVAGDESRSRTIRVGGLKAGRNVSAGQASLPPLLGDGWTVVRVVLEPADGGRPAAAGPPDGPAAGGRDAAGPLSGRDAGAPGAPALVDAGAAPSPGADAAPAPPPGADAAPGATPVPDGGPPGGPASPNDAGHTGDAEGEDADAGPGGGPGPDAAEDADAGPPVIVAVGRQGLRLRSTDRGLTWQVTAQVSAPVVTELEGVTYGAGLFVGVGARNVFVSADGASWTAIPHKFGWLQAVAHGNGRFVAVGGNYVSAWSTDGRTWEEGEPVRYEGPDYNVNTVIFHDGHFWATGVDGGRLPVTGPERWAYRVYRTPDALRRARGSDGSNQTWTYVERVISGEPSQPSIEVCEDRVRPTIECGPTPWKGFGVWLRREGNQILRSEDGRTFAPVFRASEGLRAFAFGSL
jgi:hypothetical protein